MERASPLVPLTYQQFLDFVADKDGRYEYVDGRAVAMGTPNNEHQDISLILGSALRDHLRGQRCKVRLASPLWTLGRELGRERSPDIMVTWDDADLVVGIRLNRRPKLIVEILSPNEGDDLKDKLDEYEASETVEEYIIIDSTKRWCAAGIGMRTVNFNLTRFTFPDLSALPRSATRSISTRFTVRSGSTNSP